MNYTAIDKENLLLYRNLPTNESFIFMYSGGKDSGLALSKALEVGKAVSLIHCLDSDKNESLFHEQKQSLIDIQAQKLRIPIIYVNYKWWVRWDKITKLYRDFCRQGVKYAVFGDLNSLDNIIIQVKLCKSAGMLRGTK